MVTKEWLCSAVPSTSSSLPHTHTATGNKTVTYDFAPIISREGCLDFPLEQRKEAKTINVSLVQSWAWAPLGLSSASPPSLWNILYLPNCSTLNVMVTLGLVFGPSRSQGRNVDHPKVSPLLLLLQPNRICQAELSDVFPVQQLSAVKSKCSKDMLQFFWLLSKNDPSSWFLGAGTFCCPLTCFDWRVQWL